MTGFFITLLVCEIKPMTYAHQRNLRVKLNRFANVILA